LISPRFSALRSDKEIEIPNRLAYHLASLQISKGGKTMGEFVKVATTNEIAAGQAKLVEHGGRRIAVFNIDGRFYAVDDTCTHRGGPLSEGFVQGDEVTCPWHGARFKVSSGEVLAPPASSGVTSYPTRVQGTDVEVEI
jgi:nitrite reductase/ring-hydroxylating ferredoxin subunit